MLRKRVLIYGATGFTGGLAARLASSRGLHPVLAGRSEPELARLAAELNCEHRVAPLDDSAKLDSILSDVAVVLHAAGPFIGTARPMVGACLRAGAHYLDFSGEAPVFQALQQLDSQSRQRQIMVMPGVGFSVTASDCLAVHLAERCPAARRLYIGVSRSMHISRGSLRSMAQLAGRGIQVRRNRALIAVEPGTLTRRFDYGKGPKTSVIAGWPDPFSAWYSTQIPSIEAYLESGPVETAVAGLARWTQWTAATPVWRSIATAGAKYLSAEPSPAQRNAATRVVVAECEDRSGRRTGARLVAPESYEFSASSALAIVERVLGGELAHGFQTPGTAYGAGLLRALNVAIQPLAV